MTTKYVGEPGVEARDVPATRDVAVARDVPAARDVRDVREARDLRDRLYEREAEIQGLRARLGEAQMSGIAIGVLLARTPGWTEHEALAAWDVACAQLTRDGNTRALASYIMQTGTLPGEGITARD